MNNELEQVRKRLAILIVKDLLRHRKDVMIKMPYDLVSKIISDPQIAVLAEDQSLPDKLDIYAGTENINSGGMDFIEATID